MRILIDIPEEIKSVIDRNGTNEIVIETIWQAVKNGTPIPDNATNGDVIMMMFPPSEYMNDEWWNSPYQRGGKE